MKLLSFIGTRPQYTKLKPLYDYYRMLKVDHKIIDSGQHYSANVSSDIVSDLQMTIDRTLDIPNTNELEFISSLILRGQEILKEEKPDVVFVYGDTNTTLAASLAAYKLHIPIAHVESGMRCFDNTTPEEINRIFADSVADLKFCSSLEATKNIKGGIYTGDLEYEYLWKRFYIRLSTGSPKHKKKIYVTLHRQSNINEDFIRSVLEFCNTLSKKTIFITHHRTLPVLSKIKTDTYKNITFREPYIYNDMISALEEDCCALITDSGGIQKVAPFFGLRALILRENTEWQEVVTKEYGRFGMSLGEEDAKWLLQKSDMRRNNRFYLKDGTNDEFPLMPTEIIHEHVKKLLTCR